MDEIRNDKGKIIAKLWLPVEEIEETALKQIYNMAGLPFIHKWVAIMPDVHTGIGATIGAVLPCDSVLIPAAVGVDIGCGMCAVKTNLAVAEVHPLLSNIHKEIVDRIPLGFDHRRKGQLDDVYRFVPGDFINGLKPYESYDRLPVLPQLGTLGGGNHFIELQKDKEGMVWILLHSGSRHIGNRLAENHIKTARKLTSKEGRKIPLYLDYLDEDSSEGRIYIHDMEFAMEFARQNRFVMVEIVKSILFRHFEGIIFEDTINIHHNYAAKEKHFGKEVWVHRKGATLAGGNVTGIIPGSMATPSYIVDGCDNEDSFKSCSHGAGRVMSRSKARKVVDIDNFRKNMRGIYSESINREHLDEAPEAYKAIDTVISRQNDLVDVRTRLEPILNIKG